MSEYIRPHISQTELRDDKGNIIDYGNRWASLSGPPEDSCSVVDHPERFAPLHTIAEALIDHLVTEYDVTAEEGSSAVEGLMNVPNADRIVRAVRITPNAVASAPMVFVLTNQPSVRLNAGAVFVNEYPSCVCDACDEAWESCAGELEWGVLSIATGGLTERAGEPMPSLLRSEAEQDVVRSAGSVISYKIVGHDGERASGGEVGVGAMPTVLLDAVSKKLDAVAAVSPGGNWQAWPLKS